MKQYRELVQKVLIKGVPKNDRTGVGTISLFGEMLSFELTDGFPIVTAREIDYKQAFGELTSFLRADYNKKQFQANGCNYWNKVGSTDDLGPIYGVQWRDWFHGDDLSTDQLTNIVDLLLEDPNSRRMVVSAWNINDISKMCLPPCHILFQFNLTEGYLNCAVYQRSVDIMLGLPYDIILYALLTEIIAGEIDCTPGRLTFFLGDTHIYKNHVDKAMVLLERKPNHLPRLKLDLEATIDNFTPDMAQLRDYSPHEPIKFELNL